MSVKDTCEVKCVHEEKVERYRKQVGAQETEQTASMFKALSDPTRLKIAYALTLDELCVCDVSEIVNVSMATASHHLRLLRDIGYASYRKEGKMAYYRIKEGTIKQMIQLALSESEETNHG
ncbi:MAG: ArsR/SmtB family transcription factor [Bacillus sp. (in: firmicutes)]